MAAPLKTRGLEEARSLRKRVRRQYSLNRISTEDFEYLDAKAEDIIMRINSMKEDEHGETDSDHEVG